jgi:hypothetical protein
MSSGPEYTEVEQPFIDQLVGMRDTDGPEPVDSGHGGRISAGQRF